MTSVLRTRHRATRLVAGTAVCLAVGVALAPGAAADPFSDGQWYVAPFKLADNLTVADGSGVTVAVLDGPVSPSAPSLAGADVVPASSTTCLDAQGKSPTTLDTPVANHATEMTAMIVGQGGSNVPVGVAPGAKVLTYTIGYDDDGPAGATTLTCSRPQGGADVDSAAAAAIQDAVAKGARIVSMSYGGKAAQPATQVAILSAMRKGVVFVAASDDNTTTGTRVSPPGSFNGVVLVNGIDRNGKQLSYSATGPEDGPLVVASAPGSELSLGGYDAAGSWSPTTYSDGSSPATAFVAGALATTLSKWPDATGNQLIQSLARNTGGEEHELDPRAQDGYGYGVVSLTAMLAHDPTAYPDENPTLRDGAVPSTADILEGGSSSSSAPPSSSAAGTDPASSPPVSSTPVAATDDGSSTGLVIGIGVGAVVLVAIVVLVAVLLSRRGRRGGPPPGAPGPPPPMTAGGYR